MTKYLKRSLNFCLLAGLCLSQPVLANNSSINTITAGQHIVDVNDVTNNTLRINFNAGWDNSWRRTAAPANWDALWVFAKYTTDNGVTWKHATLADSGHSATGGLTVSTGLRDPKSPYNVSTNPGVGAFLYRSSVGGGSVSSSVSLRWQYGKDLQVGQVPRIKVLGIEMVYVPEGAFYAGDNATGNGAFRQGSTGNDPWYIGSEAAISVTGGTGTGTGQAPTAAEYYIVNGTGGGGDATGSSFTIPAAFPKGYAGFYIMKYELSQAGWVDFFNMLTATQKATRDVTAGVLNSTGKASDGLVNRNNVSWSGSGDATLPPQSGANYGNVAMNFLSWADVTAYLDWAGLRPMTELEYEKAARGAGRPAVSGEYAWGTTNIVGATGITNTGLSNERASNAGANCVYNNAGGVQGPLRVGSFASGATTRESAGAGYDGAMELSGNLWERVVTVGNNSGRLFGGAHGDGQLSSVGDANESNWPATNAQGAGFRGGGWSSDASLARVSDRILAANVNSNRISNFGGRGVRFAP